MKALELTGKRFGRLVIGERAENIGRHVMWWAQCDCGLKTVVRGAHLVAGRIKSCGCYRRDFKPRTTHGAHGTPEWRSWSKMRQRCLDPNNNEYPNYGGRGIGFCVRWDEFQNFLDDMGKKPTLKHSIERLDNDADYGPANCIWADADTQANNKRNTKRYHFRGDVKTLPQWAAEYQLPSKTLWSRLREGWTFERAVLTPLRFA
jgi:hypothetical protein